jgi:PAS domain S-box-containing protein
MSTNKPTYKQLEERLRALEFEKFTSITEEKIKAMATMLDIAPNPVTVHDFKGNILYANKKSFELHGFSEAEFSSLKLREIDVPESAAKIAERIAMVDKNGEATFEVFHFRKDKTILPLEVFVAKVNWFGIPALLSIATDITERKKIEEALRSSEIKFKNIINASPMGMHLYELKENGDLVFTEANPAADKILGVDHSQFKGKTIEDAFPGLTGTEVPTRYREAALNGTSWQTEQVDYHEGIISGAFEVFAFQTEPGKMVALFNEITQRKRTQEELLKAKEKAEESDRLKTAFLQNMSHEIRTPMNAVTGFSFLLDNPELTEEKRKNFISIIIHSSNQLLSIVNDILTISAIDTKQETVTLDPVCINQVIDDLLLIFKQKAITKNVDFNCKHPLSNKQSEIYTDNTKLTQILTNLLTNALKFTQEGRIEFGYRLVGEELEFYVKDNGIGIKAQVHDKIFERFRQADMQINKKYGGTGLGLAISKAFTELLGGRIWVKSEIGKGSTFFFTVPYKPVIPEKKAGSSKSRNTKTTTILIADDEEINLLFLEELLHGLNVKLLRAMDGKETVELCKNNPSVGLILMDIRMPIMDGHKAALEIKKLRPKLPIIAQSAYALDHEIREYRKSGFDDYITKPIVKDELIEKVLKFIR